MRLKDYLSEYGISMRQFCKACDVSGVTISKYVKGGCDMRLSTALKIEQATNGAITVKDLALDAVKKGTNEKS